MCNKLTSDLVTVTASPSQAACNRSRGLEGDVLLDSNSINSNKVMTHTVTL